MKRVKRKVEKRLRISNDSDLEALEKMLTANMDKEAQPPPEIKDHVWSMLDSGSEPTIADCAKVFPSHPIQKSEGQEMGVAYKSASGQLIPNEGQVNVVHHDQNGHSSNLFCASREQGCCFCKQ